MVVCRKTQWDGEVGSVPMQSSGEEADLFNPNSTKRSGLGPRENRQRHESICLPAACLLGFHFLCEDQVFLRK